MLAEVPPHVEYALTPLGMTLTEPLAAICRWAMDHLGEVQAARTASDARWLRSPVAQRPSRSTLDRRARS